MGWLVLVGAVSLLWSRPALLLASLGLLSAAVLLAGRWLRPWWLAGAVLGPGGESLAVAAGAWTYTLTGGWLLPAWLVPAWGLAGVCLALVTEGARGLAGGPARGGR